VTTIASTTEEDERLMSAVEESAIYCELKKRVAPIAVVVQGHAGENLTDTGACYSQS